MRYSLFSPARTNLTLQDQNLLQDIVNLSQEPAILIDQTQKTVLTGNSKASALFARSLAELQDRSVGQLFLQYPLIPAKNGSQPGELDLTIIKRNGSQLQVIAWVDEIHISPKPVLLLRLKPLIQAQQEFLIQKIKDESFALIQKTMKSLAGMSFEAFIENNLQEWSSLCGTELVALYLCEEGQPNLVRKFSQPTDANFPNGLSSHDLVILNTPFLWRLGKRKVTSLHQELIKRHHPLFVFTHILGESHAPIGLLTLASEINDPPDELMDLGGLLATLLTTVIQNEGLKHNMLQKNQALSTRQKLDQVILDQMVEAVFILTPDLRICATNNAAGDMLGYSHKDFQDMPISDVLVGPNNLQSLLENIDSINDRTDLKNIPLFRRFGESFYANISVLPIYSNNHLDHVILILQDQSEQEILRVQTTRLERQAEVGFLINSFAHEVRNPLQAIISNVENIQEDFPEGNPVQATLKIIKNNVEKINDLMKTVLDYSRPFELNLKKMNVEVLLQSLLNSFYPRFEKNKIIYRMQTHTPNPMVVGDYRALEQVFSNLIANAMQAMGDQGGVLGVLIQDFEESNGEHFVEVKISDTGHGIPQDLIPKIFTPFVTTSPKGNGLGLAISQQIIVRHKGVMGVESFPGGTVFHVRIPGVPQKSQGGS